MSLRRPTDAPVHKCETMVGEGIKMVRGRPKITCKEVVSKDLRILGIGLAKDRVQWMRKIHIGDSY